MVEIIKNNADQDNTLKNELKDLAQAIDIKEKAQSFGNIDALLNTIGKLPQEQKNLALQYALKESKITIGNQTGKLETIAALFDKAVEQDNQTWKLKLKDGVSLTPEEAALIKDFLKEKESPLAYLIQTTSNFAKVQAQKGYGQNSDTLESIGIDKILGNQTKRALAGIRSWIESDLEASEDKIDVSKLTVDAILKMKYISQTLKEKIETNGGNDVKSLWGGGGDTSQYEYSNPYTNNFALRKKGDKQKEGTTSVDTGIHTENQPPKNPEEGFETNINDKETAEILMEEIQNSGVGTLPYYGREIPISCKVRDQLVVSGSPTVGGGYTTTAPIYDSITFSAEGASIKIPLKEMLNKEGEFDREYRSNTILPYQKERLKNTLLAKKIAEEVRGKTFTKTYIFNQEENGNTIKVGKNAKISKYFKLFDGQKLLIDKGIGYTFSKDERVYLQLNDKFGDESYNSPKNNPNLIIEAKELANDKGTLDEEKLKNKLKIIIENIIVNYEI